MNADVGGDDSVTLLRIFLGGRDSRGGRPVFELIVEAARAAGLAGATVFAGLEGYGSGGIVHHATWLRAGQDVPLVIEVIDSGGKIRNFVPRLQEVLAGCGMVTLQNVTLVHCAPLEEGSE